MNALEQTPRDSVLTNQGIASLTTARHKMADRVSCQKYRSGNVRYRLYLLVYLTTKSVKWKVITYLLDRLFVIIAHASCD